MAKSGKLSSEAARELSKLGAAEGGRARAARLTPEERRASARAAAEARWAKEGKMPIPRATHDGTLNIGGLILPCAVLDNGMRVLSERAFTGVLGASRGGGAYAARRSGGAELPVFLASEKLKPFIDGDLAVALSHPVEYVPLHGGRSAFGVPAEAVPKVCEVWLRARESKDAGLTGRQRQTAQNAEVLIRGLAHVGIIALVDEATGYQDERARDALAKILERFIAKELRPYIKTFPPDFYKEIYRLRGWEYPPQNNHHNSNVGKLTNDLVYERLAPGVRDELHRLTPRRPSGRLKHKLFQRLTPDFGHPKLREHLGGLVMALKLSPDWETFMSHVNRLMPKFPRAIDKRGQRALPFKEWE